MVRRMNRQMQTCLHSWPSCIQSHTAQENTRVRERNRAIQLHACTPQYLAFAMDVIFDWCICTHSHASCMHTHKHTHAHTHTHPRTHSVSLTHTNKHTHPRARACSPSSFLSLFYHVCVYVHAKCRCSAVASAYCQRT